MISNNISIMLIQFKNIIRGNYYFKVFYIIIIFTIPTQS